MEKQKTYIVCTGTEGRCVLIGRAEVEPVTGKPLVLHDARMVLRWDAECGGLLGLAAGQIGGDTRLTAEVKKTGMDTVSQWIEVTDDTPLYDWPVYRG